MHTTADTHPATPELKSAPRGSQGAETAAGSFGAIARSSLIDRDVLKRLSQRRPLELYSRLALDGMLIAAAIVICELYWSPALYVLAVMWIGARQVGIGTVALHDGAHRMLSKNRRANDLLARFLCASVFVPVFEDFDGYRKRHFEHHRATNMDDDPELWIVEKFHGIGRVKAALFLLLALSGAFFALGFLGFLRRLWMEQRPKCLAVFGFGVLVIGGTLAGFYPASLLVMYWIIPLATWGLMVNLIRALAEHYPEDEFGAGEEAPEIFHTRDVLNSWFDQLFVVTRGTNFHLSHHLIASVPFYRLAELQRELAKSEPYQKYAHVTLGYHRFLWEYLSRRKAAPSASPKSASSGDGAEVFSSPGSPECV